MVNINDNIIIPRAAEKQVYSYMKPNNVVVIYGPRRSGKTTLLRQVRDNLKEEKVLWLEGELAETQRVLSSQNLHKLKEVVGDHTVVIIDEAQAVPNIGLNLKIMVDQIPGIKIIASGSATFDLARQVGEPLVGRKSTVWLYPLWVKEINDYYGHLGLAERLPDLLVYGGYPQVQLLTSAQEKREYLSELISTYLYRDILEMDSVRNSAKIRDLLQMLALQVGQEVSHHELATALEMGTQTIARYLDLLEQSFVIVNVRGFSRNLRQEITRTSRYYFYDNGVRNALISNFNPPDTKVRSDVGALWENWLVMERLKKQHYDNILANNYFWRTYDQKELDWVEDRGGRLYGYEFKWNPQGKAKGAKLFTETYGESEVKVIHRENYLDFAG
ncbi:MAG: ATP-binding protein [bacterium]|nr:ATP-binding protein [bacterium]